ncbi:PQ loop repeat-domain-containing protein [Lipomyces tetrasporus]|uniref:PQ loop repeat-domain-containing protein n=1 Tax=Lipomyces tetrasporus TaxID=54092 RepID=A0AAD7QR16_9ASCO|nr:PQ loop repeat-domain-containing protein [Lipomyces tetrasporus]KAJ8099853.1 PQ loop repeat-domain-containing protein [Lipomyces tetrasporus]
MSTGDMDKVNGCPIRNEIGLELVQWIAKSAGSCMYGEMGGASYIFGYLSLFSWLWAQLPQIIKNYRNHSVEGLSWLFLFNWFLGDATNLIGCLLTRQLPFQTFLAMYYLIIDVVLCCQYVYYTKIQSQTYYVLLSPPEAGTPTSSHSSKTIRSNGRRRANVMLSLSAIAAIAGAMVTPPTPYGHAALPPAISTGDDMFSIMEGKFDGFRRWFKLTDREFVGRVFAWACTTMYLTSRMPQIYTNFVRQSTSGLSVLLFIAAFCGNLFYTMSIISSAATLDPSPGGERADFLWEELPYLLGSAGTVGFDFTIFLQWIYYGEGKLFFHNLYYGRKSWELADGSADADAQSLVDEDEYCADSSSSTNSSSGSSQTVSSKQVPGEEREMN